MNQSATPSQISELITVRDWLRYGVSRFQKENLVFGHGTANALDEAAFLILHALSLPIHDLEPWLDARLTTNERGAVYDILEKRVASRIPAPYLVGEAWIGPFRFAVDERVIVPRSYIGELLCEGIETVLDDPTCVEAVLDLCTGSGCLAILAAHVFENAQVDASDLSSDALGVAAQNVGAYGLEDRVSLIWSDLFEGLEGRHYDLIIANPPYVTDNAVEAFPPEYSAEPKMAHAGGIDGLDIVKRILAAAPKHLSSNGRIIVELGQAGSAFEAAFPNLNVLWIDTEESSGEVFIVDAAELRREISVGAS